MADTINEPHMSHEHCLEKLLEFLRKTPEYPCKVVTLPDFFLDRLVNLPWTPQEFTAKMADVAQRKGGSLDGIPQVDMAGGNAINVASALNTLGAEVTPIICTSEYGLEQIKYHFRNRPVDYSYIKIYGAASVTTSMEFRQTSGKSNVMIRDVGALADFGPTDLKESDYALIKAADFVCLFNWVGTLHHGTELAEAVFSVAKKGGKCRTYYDTADPNPNAAGIADLAKRVFGNGLVDVLSLNENEAVTYASHINPDFTVKNGQLPFTDKALEAARTLSKQFSIRIDLHATEFSASINGGTETKVAAFKVTPLRATGAGDSWCAANIYATHYGLPDECRLTLANALAAYYLQNPDGLHPTRRQLADFLSRQR